MVVPVRATCAQVLGFVCHIMSVEGVNNVIRLLLVLIQQRAWEVRLAALLGIQHLLASRKVSS